MTTPETDFMDELQAATNLRPHKASTLLLLSIAALIIFLLIWASTSRIEEITRGAGEVVPSSETQIVQSLEGGILQELLVSEGDMVSKDQILLRISDVTFSSEEKGTEVRFMALGAKKARLQAEISGEEFSIPADIAAALPKIAENERALHSSRQKELTTAKSILDNRIKEARAQIAETTAEIKRLRESKSLLQQELKITVEMVAQSAIPKMEEIRVRREISDVSRQLEGRTEKLPGLEAQLMAAQQERADQDNKFRTQALGELSEVETQIGQLNESLKSIGDRVYRAELRSPVDGIVNNIAIKTIGGVIEPAQQLVEIVPVDDELKIKAKVRPSDIAFLKPGQPAKVKITAYDPQRYGALQGRLTRIGATSVTDREGNVSFEIEVKTDVNHMGTVSKPLPITPGMIAEVEVITGRRTIMEYLLKPILRARDRALTER
jgi:adhesin transport system membrane fusion protein